MTPPPTSIRAITDQRVLEIGWPGGRVERLPFRFVRGRCPCAACVDEITGRRIVDVADVSVDVHPVNVTFSGNYALKVQWSDGHDTGLFTWDYLQQLRPDELGGSACP